MNKHVFKTDKPNTVWHTVAYSMFICFLEAKPYIIHKSTKPYLLILCGWKNLGFLSLKDNLPHNTCQIYVKPHSKNTQMIRESQIFDEKALR